MKNDTFGADVATLGDVDGDGTDDLLVGAPGAVPPRGRGRRGLPLHRAPVGHALGRDRRGRAGDVDGAAEEEVHPAVPGASGGAGLGP